MKFNRIDQWAEMSECGRFTVALVKLKDRFTFEAWRRQPREKLGAFPDIEAARQKCREAAA